MEERINITNRIEEEKVIGGVNGLAALAVILLLNIASIFGFVLGVINESVAVIIITAILGFMVLPVCYAGLKIINPNEALVLTLFGKYYGTLQKAGFFWVNPFCGGINPTAKPALQVKVNAGVTVAEGAAAEEKASSSKKISMKAMTLKNDKQKVNDVLGNPIEIGVNVIWQITNTAKAVFNVDNFKEYLSVQCDSALRDIVRSYPYDVSEQGDEKSLRGSSKEVALVLKEELQKKADIAGIRILEARITHLAYAPEIAAAMLQRQQAVAIIEARQKIVEGAVGMVEMALNRLNDNQVVTFDDDRKAAMVSNLLVVLCGNKDAQPIVNSGSIY
ncbi:MAG: SPFH domain-containing protein [Clostridiales bacterium]|nr:SPFH domain-containing protein [Clostridiales bacterium]